jgi:hypothetical protein
MRQTTAEASVRGTVTTTMIVRKFMARLSLDIDAFSKVSDVKDIITRTAKAPG